MENKVILTMKELHKLKLVIDYKAVEDACSLLRRHQAVVPGAGCSTMPRVGSLGRG